LTTVLDVKIMDYAHARGQQAGGDDPQLRGDAPRALRDGRQRPGVSRSAQARRMAHVNWTPDKEAIRVDLDNLTPEVVQSWKQGDRLLLNGKMLTGRDAAHKRIQDMLAKGEQLPVDFTGRVIYYVGPVDPVRRRGRRPRRPHHRDAHGQVHRDDAGARPAIAWSARPNADPVAVEAIRDHKSAYLMAVGGAAYLVARAIKGSEVVGFHDLGMEAIYEFEVSDFPVTVAVDSEGNNVHQLAPLVWKERIAKEGLLQGA
jgi:fumarate hydratase class I